MKLSKCYFPVMGLFLLLSTGAPWGLGGDFQGDAQPPADADPTPQLSAPAREVLQLAESGVGESVIIAYINGSAVSSACDPSAIARTWANLFASGTAPGSTTGTSSRPPHSD